MTQIDKAANRLNAMGATRLSIFPGESSATAEQIASEINRALDAIEAGDYDEVADTEL